ncbi:MAG: IS30 family transposase [Candidatus Yonathbacteria bacterium]|nr:IS30 family transposase [Candidatus Yonathbacteria bacterium]
MNYHRLDEDEREEISRMLAQGSSFGDIARSLGRSVSTISNEVSAGGCNQYTYRAATAHRRAQRKAGKRKLGKRKIVLVPQLRKYVHAKLRLRWSPDEIARKIAVAYPLDMTMRISPEAIYSYIYVLPKGALKKELLACLRRERKRRHKRKKGGAVPVMKGKIMDMLSIEERPQEIADRTIPGHWEGDLLVGKNRQSYLGSLVERTTRTTILIPLKNKTAEDVRKAFAKEAKKLPSQMRCSMTYDQGTEMAQHKLFTKETQMQVYFCHPASPWERGTNENTNGIIRQFFPKGTDFSRISRREVKHVQHLLNGRPRRVLGYATPYEVFNSLLR